jgi:hypothetical protein
MLLYTDKRLPVPHSWAGLAAQGVLQSDSVARRLVAFDPPTLKPQ